MTALRLQYFGAQGIHLICMRLYASLEVPLLLVVGTVPIFFHTHPFELRILPFISVIFEKDSDWFL